jgi:hypothetical protein
LHGRFRRAMRSISEVVHSTFPNRRVTNFTSNWTKRRFRRLRVQQKYYLTSSQQRILGDRTVDQKRFGAQLSIATARMILQFRTAEQRTAAVQYKSRMTLPNDPLGLPS